MTEVRLYDSTEGGFTSLGDVPFNALDSVIPSIRQWGLARETGSRFIDTDTLSGNFRVDDTGAYFEVTFE
jgi:hypothetical protein